MGAKVIVLEFNELCPELLDRFIAEGALPGFRRLRQESIVATTDAGERAPNLEPWIQWVTVHSGLPFSRHGIFELGHGGRLRASRIWDEVSASGQAVWVCAAMNGGYDSASFRGAYLPDPWSADVAPFPPRTFDAYQRLVSTYVREHTRTQAPLSLGDRVRFGLFMARNGLRLRTAAAIARQLLGELRGRGRWRRAMLLDRLQWDVFRRRWIRTTPALATFFANSTAHLQHFYWRNLEPERFASPPSPAEQAEYGAAVLRGYRNMDALVRDALKLADRETTVVLCTALSQQAMPHFDPVGGKQLYRAREPFDLARFAGVEGPFTCEPLMADAFLMRFPSGAAAEAAEARLAAVTISPGRPLLRLRRTEGVLFVASSDGQPAPADARVSGAAGQSTRFGELFYPIGATSGMHHPSGALWIRTPARVHRVVARTVALEEIAPTLLACCGLPPAPHMAAPPMPEVFPAARTPGAPAAYSTCRIVPLFGGLWRWEAEAKGCAGSAAGVAFSEAAARRAARDHMRRCKAAAKLQDAA